MAHNLETWSRELLERARLAYNNNQPGKAREILEEITARNPAFSLAFYNLGKIHEEAGHHREAIECCQAFLRLEPRSGDVTRRMAELYARSGNMEHALQLFKKACEMAPEDKTISTDFLFHLNYANLPEAAIALEHFRFGDRFSTPPSPPIKDRGDSMIRVGYVSPDFRKHAASYWIRPLLKYHDRTRFKIYCYSNFQAEDEVTEELRSHSDAWRNISTLSDEEASSLIQRDGIDILIDLAGHTGNNRLTLFAKRAAPIQISWFGYLNTTGLKTMDYRLTDTLMTSPERAGLYSEKLLFLPRAFAFESHCVKPLPTRPPREKNSYITFGSFNACEKLNLQVLELWAKILGELPSSRLFMIVEPSEEFREFLYMRFEKLGITRDRIRIEFTKRVEDFLLAAQEADIALDPFPYSGGVTVFHLLSVGVPSLTLQGTTEFSRTGSSIMRHAGFPEYTARDAKEYREKALALAGDLEALASARARAPGTIEKDGREVTRNSERVFIQLMEENRCPAKAEFRSQ